MAGSVIVLNTSSFNCRSTYDVFWLSRSLRKVPPFYDHRQDGSQQFYRKSDTGDMRKHGRPQSWYGAESPERKFKERPQSIHEISLASGDNLNLINYPFQFRLELRWSTDNTRRISLSNNYFTFRTFKNTKLA